MKRFKVFALACGIVFMSDTSGEPAELIFENGFEQLCTFYFTDADEDLFGDPATGVESCSGAPPGLVANGDDCNDSNPAIKPGAAEQQPDEQFVDENCDGIDGNAAQAVFVSAASGTDSPQCGSINAPCNSIAYGLDRAEALTLGQLYVQQGSYDPVNLDYGIAIFGGFGLQGWSRSASIATAITGGLDASSGRYQAVGILGVDVGLFDLTLNGANVAGSPADPNSYVVFAQTGSALTIERVALIQGNGGSGDPGTAGVSGSQISAQEGGIGSDGLQAVLACSTVRAAGGEGGANPSCASAGGGNGGSSGSMDTICNLGQCGVPGGNCNARDGLAGANAVVFTVNSYGTGGAGGLGLDFCGSGQQGHPGQIVHGGGGAGGSGGSVTSFIWRSTDGEAGDLGLDGSGGGGGGGGGGCDIGTDSYGGGGGGGGAGGCRAISGGTGGKGGGGSFGLHMVSGSLTARNSTFTRGNGGNGGNGGVGGLGQPGGLGGFGGLGPGSTNGAVGGSGGDGGNSGGGGGGAGGPACGMVLIETDLEMADNLNFTNGAGGSGGNGGEGGTADSNGEAGAAGAVCSTIQV